MCIGQDAGRNNTASDNTFIGQGAGYNNTTGGFNVAVGGGTYGSTQGALGQCTTGNNNTAVGSYALGALTTGTYNVAVGRRALDVTTTGNYNVAIGADAGTTSTGNECTFVGQQAGNNVTSANSCIHIGYNSGLANESKTITIGNDITNYGSNYITMGGMGLGRIYNQFSANATWSHTSDERKKKDITTNTDCGLDFLNDLRTVTYKWKAPSDMPDTFEEYNADITEPTYKNKMYGFIAQEVKSAMDKYNITDFAGWTEGKNGEQGVSYEMFVVPLVKAVQELSAKNDALQARLDAGGL